MRYVLIIPCWVLLAVVIRGMFDEEMALGPTFSNQVWSIIWLINFIDLKEETVKPSLCHSYRSSFKRQVIALPLHGQNTAAVKLIVTGQAGPLIL